MRNRQIAEITFGDGGNAIPHQLYGWSGPEDGGTWTDGNEAAVFVPERPAGPFAVELTAHAFTPPGMPAQPLRLSVNGRALNGDVPIIRGVHAWLSDPIGPHDRAIAITMRLDSAQRPLDHGHNSDDRLLGVFVRRLRVFALGKDWEPVSDPATPGGADLAFEFVSLGDDCELGLVQRAMGAEPLGLLRFSTAHLWHVMRGVETGWAGLGDGLSVGVESNEWMTREGNYRLRWHTFMRPNATTSDALLRKERPKTAFLRRKLIEDVATAGRIFVVKSRDNPAHQSQIMALHLALNRVAPNWLLWVTADGEPGTVETIAPRLMRGHISRFMRHHVADDFVLPEWRMIMGNACRMRHHGAL